MAASDRPESVSSDDEQPQSKGLNSDKIVDGFFNFTAKDAGKLEKAAFIAGRRRRRKFSAQRRKEVAEVRRLKACQDCRRRKVRCTHVLQKALPIPIIKHESRSHLHNELSDNSNSSSLSSTSSIGTHFGAYQLDRLNRFVPPEAPIHRYSGGYDEDPPAARFADAGWTSESDRDPMTESFARLSPKLEHLSNIITPQFQDGKNNYLPADGYLEAFDDMSKTLPFHTKPSMDEQLRQYLPMDEYAEPVGVWMAPRKPVPSGEQPPWHWETGKVTTQPPKTKNDGVKKNRRKGGSNGQVAPSMQLPQSEQEQRGQMDLQSVTPTHRSTAYRPQQGLSPGWTPSHQMRDRPGPVSMYRSHSDQGSIPRAPANSNSSFSPSTQSMGFHSPQTYNQQLFTPAPTPSRQRYSGPPSVPGSDPGYGMSMTPSNRSMAYRPQQMYTPQLFSPAQGSPNQSYNNTNFRPQWQQPGRILDYSMNAHNDMMRLSTASPDYGPPTERQQPLADSYGLTSTLTLNEQRLAPPIASPRVSRPLTHNTITPSTGSSSQSFASMNQTLNYNTTTPSASSNNQSFTNLNFSPAPQFTYLTSNSQPPSLTIGGSSEITPNTPLDSASHHSDVGQILSPHPPNQAGEEIDFSWLDVDMPMPMELSLAGLYTNLNFNQGPQPVSAAAGPEGYSATAGLSIAKPPNEIDAWDWTNLSPDFSDSVHDGE